MLFSKTVKFSLTQPWFSLSKLIVKTSVSNIERWIFPGTWIELFTKLTKQHKSVFSPDFVVQRLYNPQIVILHLILSKEKTSRFYWDQFTYVFVWSQENLILISLDWQNYPKMHSPMLSLRFGKWKQKAIFNIWICPIIILCFVPTVWFVCYVNKSIFLKWRLDKKNS